jgi:molybdenum cofactor cytidylyltransferase
MPTVVLILASGKGERFRRSGGTTSKLEALLHGKPVLEHMMDAVRASALPWHLEAGSHATMGDTIAAAVHATREADGWLVLPADLPLIRAQSLRAVASAVRPGHVVLPTYQAQRGHPVGFARDALDELLSVKGLPGAATVAQRRIALTLALDDPGVVTDVDTVEDLGRLEASVWKR